MPGNERSESSVSKRRPWTLMTGNILRFVVNSMFEMPVLEFY